MSVYLETARQVFYTPLTMASSICSQLLKRALEAKFSLQCAFHIRFDITASAWFVGETVVRLAEKGKAKPLEKYSIRDLSLFFYQIDWTNFFSLSLVRTIYVVNDKELIIRGLKYGRKSDRYDPYPTFLDLHPIVSSHNMLFSTEHRRLRSPLEVLFKERSFIRDYLLSLTKDIIVRFDEPLEQLAGYSIEELKKTIAPLDHLMTDVEKNIAFLSENEKISTMALIDEASVHTIATTTGFIAKLLYDHPESCKKIVEEVLDVSENLKEASVLEILTELVKNESLSPYLHAFVMEVSRLYPAAPQLIRIAKEDFSLGDQEIHAGDIIVFNIMGWQRDATIWDKPTEFIPERFFNEDSLSLTKGLLLNFGLLKSPEHCLGKEMAKYSLLLTTVILSLQEIQRGIHSKPKRPIPSYRLFPPFITLGN